jgi:hypothetical protein
MIGRMLLKNLAGLDRVAALRLNHPSDVVYKVYPALGAIEVLTPGAGHRDPLSPVIDGCELIPLQRTLVPGGGVRADRRRSGRRRT